MIVPWSHPRPTPVISTPVLPTGGVAASVFGLGLETPGRLRISPPAPDPTGPCAAPLARPRCPVPSSGPGESWQTGGSYPASSQSDLRSRPSPRLNHERLGWRHRANRRTNRRTHAIRRCPIPKACTDSRSATNSPTRGASSRGTSLPTASRCMPKGPFIVVSAALAAANDAAIVEAASRYGPLGPVRPIVVGDRPTYVWALGEQGRQAVQGIQRLHAWVANGGRTPIPVDLAPTAHWLASVAEADPAVSQRLLELFLEEGPPGQLGGARPARQRPRRPGARHPRGARSESPATLGAAEYGRGLCPRHAPPRDRPLLGCWQPA